MNHAAVEFPELGQHGLLLGIGKNTPRTAGKKHLVFLFNMAGIKIPSKSPVRPRCPRAPRRRRRDSGRWPQPAPSRSGGRARISESIPPSAAGRLAGQPGFRFARGTGCLLPCRGAHAVRVSPDEIHRRVHPPFESTREADWMCASIFRTTAIMRSINRCSIINGARACMMFPSLLV